MVADFSTGTGERRVFALVDGSRSGSTPAVDQSFDGAARRLHLRAPGTDRRSGPKSPKSRRGALHRSNNRARPHPGPGHASWCGRTTAAAWWLCWALPAVRIEPLQGPALTLAQGHSARLTAQGVAQEALALPPAHGKTVSAEVHDCPRKMWWTPCAPTTWRVARSPQAAHPRVDLAAFR